MSLLESSCKLASSVRVVRGADESFVSNAVGTLTLSSAFVASQPLLQSLFSGETVHGVQSAPEPVRGVLEALAHQGCFRLQLAQDLSQDELIERFEPTVGRWHAIYYGHPLWDDLSSGQATRDELIAWMIHNYHISRSAGATDARSAVTAPSAVLRARFSENAIGEYAHCDDFFLIRHPELGLTDDDVKNAVQSAGSLAFDQNMLRLAERDWLAHALVSFFQESSVQFYPEIVKFYRSIEVQYGIAGAFEPWIAHMDLDQGEAHADRLRSMLSGGQMLSSAQAREAVWGAAVTFHYLLSALDQIRTNRGGALRRAVRAGRVDASESSLVRAAYGEVCTTIDATSADGVATAMLALAPRRAWRPAAHAKDDREFLKSSLTCSLFRALSLSREHHEVMAIGRLCEHYRSAFASIRHDMTYFGLRPDAWLVAIANFFHERVAEPETIWAGFRYLAGRIGADYLEIQPEVLASAARWGESFQLEPRQRDRLVTRLAQLEELLGLHADSADEGVDPVSWLLE